MKVTLKEKSAEPGFKLAEFGITTFEPWPLNI
jgi:hypothetical protein